MNFSERRNIRLREEKPAIFIRNTWKLQKKSLLF